MADTGFVAERQRARTGPALAIGGLMAGTMIVLSLISLVWTPFDPSALNIRSRLTPPGWDHLAGTDTLGRDILSMVMAGGANSLMVSLSAIGLGAFAGVTLGLFAGARGGWIEEAVMRFSDFTFAFPALLTAIMLTAVFGPGPGNAIAAIAIFNIPVFARVSRGAAQPLWQSGYVLAALGLGRSMSRIAVAHILPNIMALLIVQATIQLALAIVAEASLSYLGLGIQPPDTSWGKMLNDSQTRLAQAPWMALAPGIALALTVMGLNLLGDGLRDRLDPTLRRVRST